MFLYGLVAFLLLEFLTGERHRVAKFGGNCNTRVGQFLKGGGVDKRRRHKQQQGGVPDFLRIRSVRDNSRCPTHVRMIIAESSAMFVKPDNLGISVSSNRKPSVR
jgi:hypothetical protein